MKKKMMMSFFLLLTGTLFGQSNLGEVIGTVVDKKTNQPIYDAVAFIETAGTKYQVRTGYDGRFRISGIPSGTYIMQIRQYEDTMKNIIVQVPVDGFYQTGTLKFESTIYSMAAMDAGYDKNRIRLISGDLPVRTLTAEEIDKNFHLRELNKSDKIEIQMAAPIQDEDGSVMAVLVINQLKSKLISLETGIDYRKIKSGSLTSEELQNVLRVDRYIENSGLYILDKIKSIELSYLFAKMRIGI